jgi:hypothetical protein
LERDACRAGLDRADFLRLDFVRETRARLFGVRFAAIALFMLIAALESLKLRLRLGGGFEVQDEITRARERHYSKSDSQRLALQGNLHDYFALRAAGSVE